MAGPAEIGADGKDGRKERGERERNRISRDRWPKMRKEKYFSIINY